MRTKNDDVVRLTAFVATVVVVMLLFQDSRQAPVQPGIAPVVSR